MRDIGLLRLPMEITRELFDRQCRPRFGRSNPERMRLEFWEWMIRGPERPEPADEGAAPFNLMMRDGILRSEYGPWRARDQFNLPRQEAPGPIWTFDRMGRTSTELTEGRYVCIGGEHEDSYDPDFYIYNDVVIIDEHSREIEIYGYPKDVFPPTDFHSATMIGDRIIIVGCLGYHETRRAGRTPVYALDTSNYRIVEMQTSGNPPGWIYEHEAQLDTAGVEITIRGGTVIAEKDGKQFFWSNLEDYALNARTGVWRQLTNRNWRQFAISRVDGSPLGVSPERIRPRRFEFTMEPYCSDVRMEVEGVPVLLSGGMWNVEVLIRGPMPNDTVARLGQEMRAKAEQIAGCTCEIVEPQRAP